jgi:hypothetical protein
MEDIMQVKNLGLASAMAIAATLAIAGCATAQTPPASNVTNMGQLAQKLNKLSNENSAGEHRDFGPPPPQSSIPPTPYTPVAGFWKCMGADPVKPIRSEPTPSAPRIGLTMNWVAAGPSEHGYTKLYLARGKTGYLNDRYIHPFFDKYSPSSTCTFEGVQSNGLDLFNIRSAP